MKHYNVTKIYTEIKVGRGLAMTLVVQLSEVGWATRVRMCPI
jgi:hypothetical protein